jgi:predicted ribosome quality control (RQC) complex YloA/Tae2 family protein
MDNFYLSALIKEITPKLIGKLLTRIMLVGSDLYLDFRSLEEACFHVALDDQNSGLFFDRPPKSATNEAHPFVTLLKKELGDTKLETIHKPDLDRIVILRFAGTRDHNPPQQQNLVLSLAGRHANAYLTDEDLIIDTHLKPKGKFRTGDKFTYSIDPWEPERIKESVSDSSTRDEIVEKFFDPQNSPFGPFLRQEFLTRCLTISPIQAFLSLIDDLSKNPTPLLYSNFAPQSISNDQLQLKFAQHIRSNFILSHFPSQFAESQNLTALPSSSLSEGARTFHKVVERAVLLHNDYAAVKKLIRDAVKKLEGLNHALENERAKYSDPERYKRFGDLILANLSTAKIINNKTRVIDYYDENQLEIEIEVGEGKTLQQAAAQYFLLYQKSRRALHLIIERETVTKNQLDRLFILSSELNEEMTIAQLLNLRNQAEQVLGIRKKTEGKTGSKKNREKRKPVGRWYRASSGLEIVVGRNDKENDAITFHLARSLDIWLHAADYPGSHVIIRNPNRADVPMKIIQEAAELAAFHSQAKGQKKVAVHFTQRKFVSKPPRAKPGLVRLSAFKTITVEPRATLEQIGATTP